MLTTIHPKLPMRDRNKTEEYYLNQLDFERVGETVYNDYLMVRKDHIEIHFFKFTGLKPKKNYGQVYIRTNDIKSIYQHLLDKGVEIHPNGSLKTKPWNQMEFSLLDPDKNLLTFGQAV